MPYVEAVAEELHRLVSWGMTPEQVRKQEAILDLPAARDVALYLRKSVGQNELSEAASILITAGVYAVPEPDRSAYAELLWVDKAGPRPRRELPSTTVRRRRAIERLASDGRFGDTAPSVEVWRRKLEVEFFSILAQHLIESANETAARFGAHSSGELAEYKNEGHKLGDRLVEILHADISYDYLDRNTGIERILLTVRARQRTTRHFQFDGPSIRTDLVDYMDRARFVGGKLVSYSFGTLPNEAGFVVEIPHELEVGDVHKFGITRVNGDVGVPKTFHYLATSVPVHALDVRIRFPNDDLPDAFERFYGPIYATRHGGVAQAQELHAIRRGEASEARTRFFNLTPGYVYGFRFHWTSPQIQPMKLKDVVLVDTYESAKAIKLLEQLIQEAQKESESMSNGDVAPGDGVPAESSD